MQHDQEQTYNSENSKKPSYAIGIDLGTSNSAAFVYIDEKPVMITSDGVSVISKMLSSCVAILKNGQVVVGDAAKNQLLTTPERVIYQSKRYMGTNHVWKIDNQEYRPEQVGAFILRKIKADAEKQLNGIVNEVVVTVPAQFNDQQRVATMDAIKIAGLNALRLINEPTAAAISYSSDTVHEQIVAVIDIGGGTFDITILSVQDGVYDILVTGGDSKLGGLDIDTAFSELVIKKIVETYGHFDKDNRTVYERIRTATEIAKIELSTVPTTNLVLPYLFKKEDSGDIVSVNLAIDRIELENCMKPFLEKTKTVIRTLLGEAKEKLDGKHISKLILVGGPTQAPILKTVIEKEIGVTAAQGINPNHCVAMGAARQASILAKTASNSKKDSDSILLLDVTPLSLGIEVENNATSVLIPKNSKIPTSKTQKYTTAQDGQTEVTVRVVQGERYKASENKHLGHLTLTNIPSKFKRGEPQINVSFNIDSNGILKVEAEEVSTGTKSNVTITNTSNLDKQKVDEMIRTAEKYEEADKVYKEKVQLVHTAKSQISRVAEMENAQKDLDKIPGWSEIKEHTKTLTELVSGDIDAVDSSKLKELVDACDAKFSTLLQTLNQVNAEKTTTKDSETSTNSHKDATDTASSSGGQPSSDSEEYNQEVQEPKN